ncbi:MAG: cyclic nucleotide-binding domain-containing protein, partial [Burkholderiales bacterium]
MEIDELVQAIQTLNAEDAFRARLTLEQWRSIAPYLTRHDIRAGDLLIKQGDADRTMYLLAQGSLQIFVTGGPPGSNRIAIL